MKSGSKEISPNHPIWPKIIVFYEIKGKGWWKLGLRRLFAKRFPTNATLGTTKKDACTGLQKYCTGICDFLPPRDHEIGSMEKEIGRALFRKINVCRFIVQVHSGSYVLKLSVMDTLGIFDDGGAVG